MRIFFSYHYNNRESDGVEGFGNMVVTVEKTRIDENILLMLQEKASAHTVCGQTVILYFKKLED